MSSLGDQAIAAALSGDWETAINLNTQILDTHPENIDALSRLAYAQSHMANYDEACTLYEKILTLDPYHPIAKKNLAKCKKYAASSTPPPKMTQARISPSLFVADAQKTRIVQLVNVAPRTVLQTISIGEAVTPYRKGFEMHIRNDAETYIGKLPDDIGRKLMNILNNDSPCECFVKDVSDNELKIFLKWHE